MSKFQSIPWGVSGQVVEEPGMLFLTLPLFTSYATPRVIPDSWGQLPGPYSPFPWPYTLRTVSADGHVGLQPSRRLSCPAHNLRVRTWFKFWLYPLADRPWPSHLPVQVSSIDLQCLGAESSALGAHLPALALLPEAPWDWNVLLPPLPSSLRLWPPQPHPSWGPGLPHQSALRLL